VADPTARLEKALQRVRKADAQAKFARQELRRMMREDIESGRVSQAAVARAFGVSRQRIRQMLQE
jgi:predicted XRE-type DNA-binding protein